MNKYIITLALAMIFVANSMADIGDVVTNDSGVTIGHVTQEEEYSASIHWLGGSGNTWEIRWTDETTGNVKSFQVGSSTVAGALTQVQAGIDDGSTSLPAGITKIYQANISIWRNIDGAAQTSPPNERLVSTITLTNSAYATRVDLAAAILNEANQSEAADIALGTRIDNLGSTVSSNTTNIATNDTDIATNTTDIATNVTDITTNTTDIATNVTNITTNTTDIATNVTNIATNTADITTNATAISDERLRAIGEEGRIEGLIAYEAGLRLAGVGTNADNIATNDTDIATNVTNIATNAAQISNNDADIALNAANILSNDADITTETARALLAEGLLSGSIVVNAGTISSNVANITALHQEILNLLGGTEAYNTSGTNTGGTTTNASILTITGNATDITELEQKTESLSVSADGAVTTINSGRLEVGLNRVIIQGATYDFALTHPGIDFSAMSELEYNTFIANLTEQQVIDARGFSDRIYTDAETNKLGTDLFLGFTDVDVQVDKSNLIVTHQVTGMEYNVADELQDRAIDEARLAEGIAGVRDSLNNLTATEIATIVSSIASIEAALLVNPNTSDILGLKVEVMDNFLDIKVNKGLIVQEAINRTRAIVDSEMRQALVDNAQNGHISDIYAILNDHEKRISALEGFHQAVDKSFSKVFDDGLGNKLVMHFDADGTQRGQTHQLTFLENPVIYSEDAVLWTNDNVLVNAITRVPVVPQPKRSEDNLRWKDLGV